MGSLETLWERLVALERTVAVRAREANAKDELRVYEWRPTGPPELPAIWNWIDDGTFAIIDTAKGEDTIPIVATIGCQPSELADTMFQLVRLTDVFTGTFDPATAGRRPFGGIVERARRTSTHTFVDEFNGIPVMCMNIVITVHMPKTIEPPRRP